MLTSSQLNQFAVESARNNQSPIMLVDKAILKDRAMMFKELFPNVDLYYALKCFPDPVVVKAIDPLIDGYDIASVTEIETLLSQGITPERMSYSNPVKQDVAIAAASKLKVRRFAFQSENELLKIAANAPGSSVYLRLNVQSAKGSLDFSSKFGADPREAISLLRKAAGLGLRTLGVTFHVGSQAQDTSAWKVAIAQAHELMLDAKHAKLDFTELNIGGGFPVEYKTGTLSIAELANVINEGLDKIRAEFPDVRFIAEPGRFITADSGAIVTTVIGREVRGNIPWLYLDTGTFQSFIEVFEFHEFIYPVHSIKHITNPSSLAKTESYTLTGPTCDSYDTMTYAIELPTDIQVGDKLLITMTGAYTLAYGSNFNGFAIPNIIFMDEQTPSSDIAEATQVHSVTRVGIA